MTHEKKDFMVPEEILSCYPRPPYSLPGANFYVTSFKTERDALAGMLPEKLEPIPGFEDSVSLFMNNFEVYWEAAVTVPAIFKSKGKDIPGIYLSQLYLGSIQPEGSALPTLVGQTYHGFPKREGIFTVNGFGDKKAEIKLERWGSTIFDVKFEMGDKISDLSALPFDLTQTTSFLLKAIPSCDGNGWDVLQLTSPIESGETDSASAVVPTFNGNLVLDTGRVIPIKEHLFSFYFGIKDYGLAHAEVLHDYLADE